MGFVPAAKQPLKEDPKKPSLYEGQRRRTLAMAERELFRNKILKGEYVRKDTVDKDFFRLGREIREGFDNLPSRLAAIVAAETDQQKCFDLIKAEVDQILEVLTRGRAA